MVDAVADAGLRATLRGLVLRGQRRVHWHDESPRRRKELAAALGGVDAAALTVIGTPVDPRRQDRARRQCLERLLWELGRMGVTSVLAESRQPERDRADISALAALRRSGAVPPGMRFEHARPQHEEGLWLADVVAGAVLADLWGDSGYRAAFDAGLRPVIAIALR